MVPIALLQIYDIIFAYTLRYINTASQHQQLENNAMESLPCSTVSEAAHQGTGGNNNHPSQCHESQRQPVRLYNPSSASHMGAQFPRFLEHKGFLNYIAAEGNQRPSEFSFKVPAIPSSNLGGQHTLLTPPATPSEEQDQPRKKQRVSESAADRRFSLYLDNFRLHHVAHIPIFLKGTQDWETEGDVPDDNGFKRRRGKRQAVFERKWKWERPYYDAKNDEKERMMEYEAYVAFDMLEFRRNRPSPHGKLRKRSWV